MDIFNYPCEKKYCYTHFSKLFKTLNLWPGLGKYLKLFNFGCSTMCGQSLQKKHRRHFYLNRKSFRAAKYVCTVCDAYWPLDTCQQHYAIFSTSKEEGINEVIVFDWKFSLKFSLVQATYFWFVVFIWNFIDKTLLLSTNLDVHDIKDA